MTIPVSIFGALRQNSFWDHLISGFTILGISLPSFWLGFLLLLIFAVTFPIFSVVESGSIRSFILPLFVACNADCCFHHPIVQGHSSV
ncbi:ABC transporter permease subunit [Paenibacillus rhizoplanae]|uniref:ABC transporter permease subunit n=1 Tax=Paenibacillus rhizoplanae TaxID=1917181 RepID=UPI00361F69FF